MRYEMVIDMFIDGRIAYKGDVIETDYLPPIHGKCLDEPKDTTLHLKPKGNKQVKD